MNYLSEGISFKKNFFDKERLRSVLSIDFADEFFSVPEAHGIRTTLNQEVPLSLITEIFPNTSLIVNENTTQETKRALTNTLYEILFGNKQNK